MESQPVGMWGHWLSELFCVLSATVEVTGPGSCLPALHVCGEFIKRLMLGTEKLALSRQKAKTKNIYFFWVVIGQVILPSELGCSLENKTWNTVSRCQLPGKGFLSFGETGDFMWGFVHWTLSLSQLSRGLGLFLFFPSSLAEPLTATWNKFLEGDHSHRALHLSIYTGKILFVHVED